MRKVVVWAMTAALGCLGSSPAFAWGRDGHQAVAAIAAEQLSNQAREGVAALLGESDVKAAMVTVSTWPDEIRMRRPDTGHWHYVDFPLGRTVYDPSYCTNDGCVVEAIPRFAAIVKDTSLAEPVRAEALKFLIHFVADIHQPLHATDNQDRGGNEVAIVVNGRKTNLHAEWDSGIIEHAVRLGKGAALGDAIATMTAPADFALWQSGDAVAWATESHAVGREVAYAPLQGLGGTGAPIILPGSYETDAAPIVKDRLAKAGARLAWVLNNSF